MQGRWRSLALAVGLLLAALALWWWRAAPEGLPTVGPNIDAAPGARPAGELASDVAAPSFARSPRTAPGAEEASLSLVDVRTRRPALGTRWVIESPGADRFEREVTAEPWRLPAGKWRFDCVDGELSTLEKEWTLVEAGAQIVWVAEPARLEVEVVDPQERPVAGAVLRWTAAAAPLDALGTRGFWSEEDVLALARTDAEGRATIDAGVSRPGTLYVAAGGYGHASCAVLGSAELRIVLRRAASLRDEIRALGVVSREPLAGVRLWSRMGPVTEPAGHDGLLRFVSEVGPDETLRARGPGIVPTSFRLGELQGPRALLLEAARLSIEVREPDGSGASEAEVVVVADVEDLGEASGPPVVPARARFEGAGRFECLVPLGRQVHLLASSPSGSAQRSLVPEAELQHVTLELGTGPVLRVRLPAAADASESVSTTLAFSNRHERRLPPGVDDGVLEVLHPGHVRRILVEVAGYARLELEPRPDRPIGLSLDGDLTPGMTRAHRVPFLVRDEEGEPVVGVSMRFSWKQTHVREHPGLGGSRPTDHPGWMERVSSRLEGVTGADGRLTLSLPEGEYTVFVAPDPRVDLPNHGNAHSFAYTARVYGDELQEWSVPALRLATLHVLDATGKPVDGVSVQVPGSIAGSESRCAGPRWQGWISAAAGELFVSATRDRGRARVTLEAGRRPIERTVVLGGLRSALQLTGDVAGLIGRELEMVARASPSAEAPAVWDERIEVEDPGWIPFDIPGDGGSFVEIVPVRTEEGVLVFEPSSQPWHPGAVLRCTVTRTPR